MLQLAPVAAAAAPSVTPQSTPGPAAAKATAGSRAGAVMKAVALAANKAAGKLKGTAPQPKAAAAKSTDVASAGGWCTRCLFRQICWLSMLVCITLLMTRSVECSSGGSSEPAAFMAILTCTDILVYSLIPHSVSHTST